MKDICLIGTNGQQKPIISAACRWLNVSFPSNLTRKLHTHQILEESSPEQEMMIWTKKNPKAWLPNLIKKTKTLYGLTIASQDLIDNISWFDNLTDLADLHLHDAICWKLRILVVSSIDSIASPSSLICSESMVLDLQPNLMFQITSTFRLVLPLVKSPVDSSWDG